MTGDKLSFLDETPSESVVSTEGVSPEAPEASGGQPRAPDGKFASKGEGEAEPAQAAPAAAPPAAGQSGDDEASRFKALLDEREKESSGRLAAMLDDREKRQKAEARAAMLERQLAAIHQQNQPQPTLPDPVEDTEGYTRSIIDAIGQQTQAAMLRQSEFFARREFGQDLVDQAMAFFDGQPRHVSEQFLREPSPFHAAVEWFKQRKTADEIGDDPAAFRTKIEAELRERLEAEIMTKLQAQTPDRARPTPPPPSMAATPSVGSKEPAGAGSGFDKAFPA